MIPARRKAFVPDADLLGALLREEIECDVVEDGEIFWRMARADARLILMQGDVEDPVEAVFNGPVAAHDPGEGRGVRGQARDEEPGLVGGAVADGTLAIHAENAAQTRPAGPIREPREIVGGPRSADLDAAVVAVDGVRGRVGRPGKRVGLGVEEERPDVVMQARLVALETQHVVAAPIEKMIV